MLIDWFTVIAQIVNFLILVALLKHFLYGRIVDAMDEREEKIASRLEEARKEKEEAGKRSRRYREKEEALESRKDDLLSQAKEAAEKRKKELLREVRTEVDRHEEEWHGALERKKQSFLEELRERSGRQVLDIARQALDDLAGADLEERIVDVFVGKIRGMDEDDRERFLSAGNEPVRVKSRFEIDQGGKQKVTRALREIADDSLDVEYRTREDVIMGIELRAGGFRLAWSVDRYLDELESRVREALEETSRGKEGEREKERREKREEEEKEEEPEKSRREKKGKGEEGDGDREKGEEEGKEGTDGAEK